MSDNKASKLKDNLGRSLVYDLFYPGVLGSMIFDIFDPLRPGKIYKIPLFVIAITFMTDFFHMTNNLKAQTNQNSKPLINILKKSTDAIIAAMFCLSYFFYAKI